MQGVIRWSVGGRPPAPLPLIRLYEASTPRTPPPPPPPAGASEVARLAAAAPQIAGLSHRTLVVRLRTGAKRDKRAVRADGHWLPGIFQTRGIGQRGDAQILIPFRPILEDYKAGLFPLSKNGRVRLDGPLYHVAFATDADAAAAGWAHTRGVLRNVTVLPTRDAPGGASLVAAPLDAPARVRVPTRVRGVDRCAGLQEEGGWLNHLTQGVDVEVAVGAVAPLWVTADVGGLGLRGRVCVGELDGGPGVRVVGDPTKIVAVISK